MKNSGIEWIGEIPDDWEIRPLKYLFSFEKGLPITKADLLPSGIKVISYGQIHAKYNRSAYVDEQLYRYVSEKYLKANRNSLVQKGDFIFADTSEDIEGAGDFVYIDIKDIIFAGYHSIILRHRSKDKNKYLAYLFMTKEWKSQIQSRVSGIKVYSISRGILAKASVLLPPMQRQCQIVEFLDKKCAAVDRLIENQRAQIEKLKEYKQSVITEAVTHGLDSSAPLKDSGVEWLSKIPEKWIIKKVNIIFSIVGSGTTPNSSDSSYYDGNIPWIQSGDLNCDVITKTQKTLTREALSTFSALKLYEDPFLVIAMYGASIGNIAYSRLTATTNQACCVLAKCYENLRYFYYTFIASKSILIDKAKGGTQPNISQDIIKRHRLPVPPLEEQRKIADYLDKKCEEIDKLIAIKQQKIEILTEYKKSLIYEYVTGKKQVI